ncbi:hypothetical protein J4448_05265 [Candidatus Woesearchaeota archaeon]|nr:hypothetical protein [Candidatus Woesearchaeota archaeon]
MENLINVYNGIPSRASIAKVKGYDVGISPEATYCTSYVIHHTTRKEGYIGHFDNGGGEDALKKIQQKLREELSPAISEYGGQSGNLEIIIAGTNIRKALSLDHKTKTKEFEIELRRTVLEVFRRNFPHAHYQLMFNDGSSPSQCILYVPKHDIILVVDDSKAWDI